MRINPMRILVAAALLAIAGLTACSKHEAPVPQPEVVGGVRVIQATERKVPDTVDVVGTVRAAESATLTPQVMGTVRYVAAKEGDHVRAGEALVTIDAAQMSAQVQRSEASVSAMKEQVAAAESDAALAASTLKRYEMLKAQNSVSPHEFEEVEARAKAADARLAATRSQQAEAVAATSAARTMLGYTRIHAPFDGMVTERKVDPGATAAPGVPLLTLEKSGPLRLEISVDESLLSAVRVGSSIPVVIDALDSDNPRLAPEKHGAEPGAPSGQIEGKVARIVPAADPSSRTFLVKIDLPAMKGLYTGMFGHALVARGGARDLLALPKSAIVTHGSMQSVYVVGPDRIATVRYISLGNTSGNEVEVLSGLSSGEAVIDSPGDRELGGKRIEVSQ